MSDTVVPEMIERVPSVKAGDRADPRETEHHHRRSERERNYDQRQAQPGREAQGERQLTALCVAEAIPLRGEIRAHPDGSVHVTGPRLFVMRLWCVSRALPLAAIRSSPPPGAARSGRPLAG